MLRLHPELPRDIARLEMQIRGHSIDLRLTHALLAVQMHDGGAPSICVSVDDVLYELASGARREFPLQDRGSRKTGATPAAPTDLPAR